MIARDFELIERGMRGKGRISKKYMQMIHVCEIRSCSSVTSTRWSCAASLLLQIYSCILTYT